MTPAIPGGATGEVAGRIAEALGLSPYPSPNPGSKSVVFRREGGRLGVDALWYMPHIPAIHVYSPPDDDGIVFGFRIDFCDGQPKVHPSWSERWRWTDGVREFVRKIDGLTDGMVCYGLHRAGETDLLRWLTAPDADGDGT